MHAGGKAASAKNLSNGVRVNANYELPNQIHNCMMCSPFREEKQNSDKKQEARNKKGKTRRKRMRIEA